MSSIGWIDFSSKHRDKVRTVIDLLSAPGVVDELGIRVVHSAELKKGRVARAVSGGQTSNYLSSPMEIVEWIENGFNRHY